MYQSPYRRAASFARPVLLAVVLLSRGTVATAKNWSDGTDFWSVANKWSPASVPVLNEAVNIAFTDGTARTVTYDVSAPALGLLSIDLTGAGTAASTLSMPNNNNLTAAAITVGGYNGASLTNGRGAVNQSAGSTTISAGWDLILAWGAGSTGTYTLSGGAIVAKQAELIGTGGAGVFHHTGGTNTIESSTFGLFAVGYNAGSAGTYNLSGTGALTVNTSEFVGYSGSGIFNQTGGTNLVTGSAGVTLGYAAGSNGTYNISGGSLTSNTQIVVGSSGAGALTIQSGGSVSTNNLSINSSSAINLNGGTLRFNGYSRAAGGLLIHTAGAIQLAGSRNIGSDLAIADLFGSAPIITANKTLTVEGSVTVKANTTLSGGALDVWNAMTLSVDRTDQTNVIVAGGKLSVTNSLVVAEAGDATLQISGGGRVESASAELGKYTTPHSCGLGQTCYDFAVGNVTVTGLGSKWEITTGLTLGGPIALTSGYGTLNVVDSGLVSIGGELQINGNSSVSLNGGTLRFNSLTGGGAFLFNSGAIQLAGDRNVGVDALVTKFFGATPTIVTGKKLTVEGIATLSTRLKIDGGTFKANALSFTNGGELDFYRGTLEVADGPIPGLSNLVIPAYGEFRVAGVQSLRVAGAIGSTITATGNLTIGNAAAVNGFATQGTINVGANSVALLDGNDVVFDSLALATLGSGITPGTLTAANGLTLDFGGNITGFGTVSTPNLLAKPLINNGHITGTSATQRITLPGYVKGVGTFDNVNITGTFSPGLSPTILSVGNIAFSPASTLVMELGDTAPGSGYDQIQSTGTLTFDGTLQISLINGFVPTPGQSFDLFDTATTSGAFDTLQLPSLPGFVWNTTQLAAGMLTVALPGDFNFDGAVDAADYVVWRKATGTPAAYSQWRLNFGRTIGSGSGATSSAHAQPVPEPATLWLGLLVTAPIVARRTNSKLASGAHS